MVANAYVQRVNKTFGVGFVNYLVGNQNKFNPVTGSEVKNFSYIKLIFYHLKLIGQILLANHQPSQFLQLNLFVRKSDYL